MEIKGVVESIIFYSDKTGYGVFTLATSDADAEEIKCAGSARGISAGEYLELSGAFKEHPVHGPQFEFKTLKVVPPDGLIAIERYLASGAIKGIGAALALRITKKFGDDTIRIMEEEPERLAQVRGISERMAREIGVQVYEKRDFRNALMFLQEYGITNNLAAKIYDYYKDELYRIIKENPYKVAFDIRGIGFKTMDEIALKNGVAHNCEERMAGGIIYCLQLAMSEGHTYLPEPVLFEKTAELLQIKTDELPVALDNLHVARKVIIRKDRAEYEKGSDKSGKTDAEPSNNEEFRKVFLSYNFFAEFNAAKRLRELNDSVDFRKMKSVSKEELDNQIRVISAQHGFTLDEMQRKAVQLSIQNGIFILTGGPGTGKTTTICAMISYFYENGLEVSLAAPTGRAAKRMEEATGYCAKTIHRLLEVNGAMEGGSDLGSFLRNSSNPLESDVIIVDEMSMVDIHLFNALLDAIPNGARLILSGDSYQLPSVGPGNVLKDLLRCGYIESVALDRIYRQSDGSDIANYAALIKNGTVPPFENKSRDFFFLKRTDKMQLYRDCVVLIRDQLPRNFNLASKDIQVLSPRKKGDYGVMVFNRLFQEQLNPASDTKGELLRGDCLFRLGDKVMQIKNNYETEWVIRGINGIAVERGKGVFNGDTGIIKEIFPVSKHMIVMFDDNKEVDYAYTQLEELELAYAITIHKSQGSEYPVVLLPIMDGPEMLMNRNLIYTAITRARHCLIILGSREMVEKMISNNGEQKRFTDFSNRLLESMGD